MDMRTALPSVILARFFSRDMLGESGTVQMLSTSISLSTSVSSLVSVAATVAGMCIEARVQAGFDVRMLLNGMCVEEARRCANVEEVVDAAAVFNFLLGCFMSAVVLSICLRSALGGVFPCCARSARLCASIISFSSSSISTLTAPAVEDRRLCLLAFAVWRDGGLILLRFAGSVKCDLCAVSGSGENGFMLHSMSDNVSCPGL